jgi:phosphate transport system protein
MPAPNATAVPTASPILNGPGLDGGRWFAEIDEHVRAMFAEIPIQLRSATAAFIAGDRELARQVIENDEAVDMLLDDVELMAQSALGRQRLADCDLRYLITVLRIVPELERSADLVEHIALRAHPALTGNLSDEARNHVSAMGASAVDMWLVAAKAFAMRDASAVVALRERDDVVDDLHVQLTSELSHQRLDASVAIELGLVARFFERLGDHAVNVVRRLAYLDGAPVGRP